MKPILTNKDIAEGVIGESISFIFEKKTKDGGKLLKGIRIYPKNIKNCVIETYNEVKNKKEDGIPRTAKAVSVRPTIL